MISDYVEFSAQHIVSKIIGPPTTANNSSSFVEFFFLASFRNLEANEMGLYPSGPNCSSTAPNLWWLATQTIRMSRWTSKCRSLTMFASCSFKFSNADWHYFDHIISFFRLSKGRKRADVSASAGRHLCKL